MYSWLIIYSDSRPSEVIKTTTKNIGFLHKGISLRTGPEDKITIIPYEDLLVISPYEEKKS